MPLVPFLPVVKGESLTSYLVRVAQFHANMDLDVFLRFIEFPQCNLMKLEDAMIDRLAALLSVPQAELEKMAFVSVAERKRRFCGEEFHAEFANLAMTSYCPACLLDDTKSDIDTAEHRFGRINWMIEHHRTCATHNIGLVRRKNTSHMEKLQLMSMVAPDNLTLERMVNSAPKQRVSDLQHYITARLAGERGPDWLDGQQIDLAARACEMIGVVLTAGPHVHLPQLSEAEWNEAGHVGFGFARRGKSGIEDALRLMKQRFDETGKNGGPQQAFGRLYQWLQFKRNVKQSGPIRGIVREFILDNFLIEAGAELMGETVDYQRVHSVHSLAKLTGEHPKTINRALILSGMMAGDPDTVRGTSVCDANAAEKLLRRVQSSIPVTKLPDHLNCSRGQAEQFVRTGLIPRLLAESDRLSGVLKQVALEDADAFLDDLLAAAERKSASAEGMMDINSASAVARCPVLEIVNGILAGQFESVGVVDPSLKFKAVMVDPVEVRETLARQMAEGWVGLDEGARIIGIPKYGLSGLAKLHAADGTSYVRDDWVENSKGIRIRLFNKVDLEDFRRRYVSLKEIAEGAQLAPKQVKMKLNALGVKPAVASAHLGRVFYRRCDLRDS